ncbi:MAG: hypothetical protein K2X81_05625, partial [Candidatus Obscuribacterales bacterium]|nr:hypothetical protein [Candidatus Obscuribacterales bacterium]
QTFASKLKELPASESVSKMSEYLDRSLPKFGPKLASDGPSMKQVKAGNEAEDQVLKMVKHSDRGKSFDRGGDKARESKQLDNMRESFQIEKLMKEGWTEKHEARTVKYMRDKGETITKNPYEGKVEGTMAKQTDGWEWELKYISKIDDRGKIGRGILDHAKDACEKYTGIDGTQIGRVLIDGRDQVGLTEAIAEKAMREAALRISKLEEIRIVGQNFDISLKPGRHEKIKRW